MNETPKLKRTRQIDVYETDPLTGARYRTDENLTADPGKQTAAKSGGYSVGHIVVGIILGIVLGYAWAHSQQVNREYLCKTYGMYCGDNQ